MHENIWRFTFKAKILTDQNLKPSAYRSLDEAHGELAADHEGVGRWPRVASRIKVAHAVLAAAAPTVHEFLHPPGRPVETYRGHLATEAEGLSPMERYARRQSLVTASGGSRLGPS